jgi:hypothetical protein
MRRNEKLDWFTWYRFKNPEITYKIIDEFENKFYFLNNNDFVPNTDENKYWRDSYPSNYKKVQWTFIGEKMIYYFGDSIYRNKEFGYWRNYNKNKLLCNGFCIPGYNQNIYLHNYMHMLISVYDYYAKLPLTLDRNMIEGDDLPFLSTIVEDIAKDLVSRLLTLKINQPINYKIRNNDFDINYNIEFDFTGELIFKNRGYILFCNHILKKLKMYKITSIWFFDIPDSNMQFNFNENVINYIHKSKSIKSFNNIVLEKFNNCKMNIHNLFYIRNTFCKRVILKKKHFNYLFNKKINRADKHISQTYDREKIESNDWVSIISHKKEMKNQPNLFRCEINFDNLEKYNDNVDIIIENFNFSELKSQELIVTRQLEMALDKYLGPDYIIPYDIEERKKKYPLAFSELERFINNYI